MGIAVFKDGKLIGELNGLESICHLIISGDLDYCNIQIQDPNKTTENINLQLKLAKKPKITLKLINGFAYIDINIKMNVQINSANTSSDYSDYASSVELENEINSYLEKILYNYLYKVSKEFNSDIDGFGKYAVKHFKTMEDWNNYDWLNNYKNSFFKVTVKSKIKSNANFINS